MDTEAGRVNPAKVDPHISRRPATHVVVVGVLLFSPRVLVAEKPAPFFVVRLGRRLRRRGYFNHLSPSVTLRCR